MDYRIIVIVKIFLFAASNLGLYSFIREKTELHISFIPILTVSIQIMLLTFAGFVNLLTEMTYLMYLFGIGYFLKDLFRQKLSGSRAFLSPEYVFLGVMLVTVLLAVRGSSFFHYDDFSHWGVVTRIMLENDRFPNAVDPMISFMEYPLGSATYIYYFCRLTAGTESFQMLAQAFMILAALLPIFSRVRKNRGLAFCFMLIFANLIMTCLIPVQSLLVDTLLPLFGMAALLLLNTGGTREERDRAAICAMPMLASVMLIKNSGFFFLLIGMAMVFWPRIRNRQLSRKILFAYLIPFAAMYLWKMHCLMVFGDPEMSKHAMTMANYISQFRQKEIGDMQQICLDVLRYMLTMPALPAIGAGIAVLYGLIRLTGSDRRKQFVKSTGILIVVYGLHIVGMCGMYIFSMPPQEAETLAGIDRYTGSAVIAQLYFLAVWMMNILSDLEGRTVRTVCWCTAFLGEILIWGGLTDFSVIHGGQSSPLRNEIEAVAADYGIPTGQTYYLYGDDPEHNGYLYNVSGYVLWSSDVTVDPEVTAEDLESIEDVQYLILLKPAEAVLDNWIRENYPDQYGSRVIAIG